MLGAALAALIVATPALADALIDNVQGIALDKDGKVIHFTGLLMTPAGKITKLLKDGDKRPDKLDWRTDMHGRVMLPGFVDAHGHMMDLGFRSLELDLSDTHSLDEAKAKITAYIAANPDKKWILGGGWDQEKWGLGHFPTAADLDSVAQGRPIVLDRIDSHAVWADSAAMKAAGVTPATKAPPGGQIVNGVFVDAARQMIMKAVPQPLARERDLAFIKAQQLLLADGITATDDMRTTLDDWLVFRRAADAGNLRMRIVSYADSIETANRAAGNGPSPWLYDDKLRMVGVKVFADGALGSRGACLKVPYADDPKSSGTCLLSDDQLRNTMSRMNAQAVLASAESIRQQGLSNMVGNITGASLQLGMAGAGAFKSMQGLSGERNAMKARATAPDGAPPQTMPPGTAGVQPSVDTPSTTQPPPGRPDAPAPAPDLAPAPDVTPAPTNSLADEMDNIAKVAQAKGTALTMLSRPVGDIATAGGTFAERLAMQEQKLNDGASTVNKNSADSMQDVANRDNALLAEMLRAIDSVAQSRSGAMSNIAGNIRA